MSCTQVWHDFSISKRFFLYYIGKWSQCTGRQGPPVVCREKGNSEKPFPINKIGEIPNIHCWRDGRDGISHALGGSKLAQTFWKLKLQMYMTFYQFSWEYALEELCTLKQGNSCKSSHNSTVSNSSKIGNHLKCSSIGKHIHKLWHIPMMQSLHQLK